MRKGIVLLVAFCGLGMAAAPAQTFNRFNFNVGGGFGGALGDVGKFTGTSYNGVAGGGWNFSRSFGVKAEYMYFNLEFTDSAKAQVLGATGYVQSGTLNLVYSHSLQDKLGVYAIGGGGWYQRSLDARSQFLPSGANYDPAWQLWGITFIDGPAGRRVDVDQTLSSHSVSAGGYNFGGGLTYRLKMMSAKVYVEGRYHRANTSDGHTTLFPVTVGLRW